VTSVLLLAAGLTAVAASAVLFALSLPRLVLSELALTAYVLGFGEVVVLMLALSPADAVERRPLLAGTAIFLGGGVLVWTLRGRPRTPLPRPADAFALVRADPLVTVLAVGVAAALVYVAALSVLTPENNGDALAYHMPRAALWAQEHAVGYVSNPTDGRLNPNPPNAELGQLYAIAVEGTDRFVGLLQLAALLATCSAVVLLARRLGIGRRGAFFGALLYALLPVVLLQAGTALNDLVVASLVSSALALALAERTSLHLVAGLALALAMGAKYSTLLAAPLLAIACLLAQPARRLVSLAAIGGAGLLLGSYWSLVNERETGELDGGLAEGQVADHTVRAILGTAGRLARRSLDVPGTPGLELLVYPLVALGLALLALRRRSTATGKALLGAALLVGLVPPTVRLLGVLLGSDEDALTAAEGTISWYGPAGAVLAVAGVAAAVQAARHGRVGPVAVFLALAPAVQLVVLSVAIAYDPFRGRFFMTAFAIAAATWGLLLPHRAIAAGVVVLALTAAGMTLVHSDAKPTGLGLFERGEPTVWGKPRWHVQALLRPKTGERSVLRLVEEHVPANATIGLVLRPNDLLSPFFGQPLGRMVELLPQGTLPAPSTNWLVISPGRAVPGCLSDWRQELGLRLGWIVVRRVASGSCS
jgi:hypothetical protein